MLWIRLVAVIVVIVVIVAILLTARWWLSAGRRVRGAVLDSVYADEIDAAREAEAIEARRADDERVERIFKEDEERERRKWASLEGEDEKP